LLCDGSHVHSIPAGSAEGGDSDVGVGVLQRFGNDAPAVVGRGQQPQGSGVDPGVRVLEQIG
jgi:hypothetical protein